MKVADIMTSRVFTINNLVTVAEAIAEMKNHQVRSLVVKPSSNDNTYGIITETDIVYNIIAKERDPETIFVYQIMTKPCITVSPDLSVLDVARLFAETGIEKAPVIQEQLLGMISATDLIMKLKVREQTPSNQASAKIREAILHERIIPDSEKQIERECEIAWDVVEELQAE
jgi:CBS domain-containing protein